MSTASELPAVTEGLSIGIIEIPSRPLFTLNDAETGGVITLYRLVGLNYMTKIITWGSSNYKNGSIGADSDRRR
jgi:hypothetical protein